MISFANTAWAAGAEAMAQPSIWQSLAPIVMICVVFYFLLIRPQQKQLRKHQDMVNTLKKGDHVVTSNGMLAVVVNVGGDNFVTVEIAPEVYVKLKKENVAEVLADKKLSLAAPKDKSKNNKKAKVQKSNG